MTEETICPRARGRGLGNEKLVRIILHTREKEEKANLRLTIHSRWDTPSPVLSWYS